MEELTLDDSFLLEEAELSDGDQRSSRSLVWLIAVAGGALALICALAAVIVPLMLGKQNTTETASAKDFAALAPSCDVQVKEALKRLEETCLALGLDEVCYGNNTLRAQLMDANARFDNRGDVIPVEVLQSLKAAPLDTRTGDWGIAVFKT